MKRKAKPKPPDLTVTMTQVQAELLGIVRCKHCGYPPNNHFNWSGGALPDGTCAHAKNCSGYKQVVALPEED